MKKKLLTVALATALLTPTIFSLNGCSCSKQDPDESKVMSVGLNPEIEFILNKDNKVVTVNALNDEGNHIISIVADSNQVFENMTAEDAVDLFLKVTKENGYVVSGENTENELVISIGGEFDNLYNSVKESAEDYLSELNISAEITKDEITKDELIAEVKECLKEYTSTELEAKTEEELVQLLESSRKETKNMLTEELKNLYYELRFDEIKNSEFTALQTALSNYGSLASNALSELNTVLSTLSTTMTQFTSAYNTNFLDENSAYNQAMDSFISAKNSLRQARLNNESVLTQDQWNTLEASVTSAENALALAKTTAEGALTQFSNTITSAYNTIETVIIPMIDIFLNDTQMKAIQTAMANAQETIKTNYKSTFETTYEDFLGENSYWANITLPTIGE